MVESSGLSLTHLLHGENKRALRACLGGKANAMRFGRGIFGAIELMEERSSAGGDGDGDDGVCDSGELPRVLGCLQSEVRF